MIVSVYHMEVAERTEGDEGKEGFLENEGFEELIDHLGRLLAEEYVSLMKKSQEVKNEGSHLCQVFKRESEAGKS